jgi:hypothetical protein
VPTSPARIALTADTLTAYAATLPGHLPPGVTLSDYALAAPDHVVVLARRTEDGAWIVWSHYPNGSTGVHGGEYLDSAERIEARAAFDARAAGRRRSG